MIYSFYNIAGGKLSFNNSLLTSSIYNVIDQNNLFLKKQHYSATPAIQRDYPASLSALIESSAFHSCENLPISSSTSDQLKQAAGQDKTRREKHSQQLIHEVNHQAQTKYSSNQNGKKKNRSNRDEQKEREI